MLGPAYQPLAEDDPLPPVDDRVAPATCDLDQLYKEAKAGLLRFVRAGGNRQDAEDVVQQAFVRMAARSNESPILTPRNFLHHVARNVMFDRGSRSKFEQEAHHIPIHEIAALEARDRLMRINEAVLKLKPITRQVFLAVRLDGLSYGEIAEQTGLGVRGVETQMRRALKKLDRHLSRND